MALLPWQGPPTGARAWGRRRAPRGRGHTHTHLHGAIPFCTSKHLKRVALRFKGLWGSGRREGGLYSRQSQCQQGCAGQVPWLASSPRAPCPGRLGVGGDGKGVLKGEDSRAGGGPSHTSRSRKQKTKVLVAVVTMSCGHRRAPAGRGGGGLLPVPPLHPVHGAAARLSRGEL